MASSSQRDMFMSSPESSPRMRSSLPSSLAYVYLWVILFDWDENVEEPFNIYQVAMFSPSELKPKWLSGDFEIDSRKKKISFSAIPGKTFSLFAKVEKCELIFGCNLKIIDLFFKLCPIFYINYRYGF